MTQRGSKHPPKERPIEIETHGSITAIGPEAWDRCACPEAGQGRARDPFTTYRFLHALELSGSVGPGTGWQPHYLSARADVAGQGLGVIAVAPMYAKGHSQGEYIFDHNWAHALEAAGGSYYPKLQIAVPFTPATGRRLLTRPGWDEIGRAALIQGAVQVASQNDLSSLHVTFCTQAEMSAMGEMGLMPRHTQQFHWVNNGYDSFDGFLAALSSRKRKMIRRERQRANGFGGEIVMLSGDDIEPHHWDAFWDFYQDTGARKWGTPYLTRAFFDEIHETMRDDMVLALALREGRPVAGALNFIGRDALFGRYWGCVEHHDCLHFELCYYRAIEEAIARGLDRVEAGAQGEHKLARGYLPAPTHSAHWIADGGFAKAISRYLKAEARAVDQEIEILTDYGPFRRETRDETD